MSDDVLTTLRAHLIEVVGYAFGAAPEQHVEQIRALKQREASAICNTLRLGPNDAVMDLGCGMGYGAAFVAARVARLYCCDVRETFLNYARQECRPHQNVTFHHKPRVGEFTFLPTASLDAIYSAGVFIHLNLFDVYWHLREFSRVLRPGGRLVFNVARTEKLFEQVEETQAFLEMAEAYRRNPTTFVGLMQWNSTDTILRMARQFGFELVRDGWCHLFERNTAPAPELLADPSAIEPQPALEPVHPRRSDARLRLHSRSPGSASVAGRFPRAR